MKGLLPWLLPLLVVVRVVAGCDAGGRTLIVEVVTDLRPGTEFVTVRGVLSAPGRPDVTIPAVLGADFGDPVRLAEFDGLTDGDYELVVTAADVAGRAVVARTVIVDLRQNLAVTVALSRSCRDTVCPAPGDAPSLTTCASGRCVDPACSELAVDRCEPGECAAHADCTAGSDCAAGICVEGGCLYAEDDRACPGGQTCSLSMGCVDVGGPTDAGMDTSVPPRDTGPDVTDAAADTGPSCASEVLLASVATDAISGGFSGSPYETLVITLAPAGPGAIGDEDLLPSGYTGVREFRRSNDSDFDLVVAAFMDGSTVRPRINVSTPAVVGGGRLEMLSEPLDGTIITMVHRDVSAFSFTSAGGYTNYDATTYWEFWGCRPGS